jgi:hypothetical protein
MQKTLVIVTLSKLTSVGIPLTVFGLRSDTTVTGILIPVSICGYLDYHWEFEDPNGNTWIFPKWMAQVI